MITKPLKNKIRKKRQLRIRNKISGTPDMPRLNVFRSNKQIYAQLIDVVNGVTDGIDDMTDSVTGSSNTGSPANGNTRASASPSASPVKK